MAFQAWEGYGWTCAAPCQGHCGRESCPDEGGAQASEAVAITVAPCGCHGGRAWRMALGKPGHSCPHPALPWSLPPEAWSVQGFADVTTREHSGVTAFWEHRRGGATPTACPTPPFPPNRDWSRGKVLLTGKLAHPAQRGATTNRWDFSLNSGVAVLTA